MTSSWSFILRRILIFRISQSLYSHPTRIWYNFPHYLSRKRKEGSIWKLRNAVQNLLPTSDGSNELVLPFCPSSLWGSWILVLAVRRIRVAGTITLSRIWRRSTRSSHIPQLQLKRYFIYQMHISSQRTVVKLHRLYRSNVQNLVQPDCTKRAHGASNVNQICYQLRSGGWTPTSHRGGQGSSPGQYMWDLLWRKRHWDRFLFGKFRLPLPVPFHQRAILIHFRRCTNVVTGGLISTRNFRSGFRYRGYGNEKSIKVKITVVNWRSKGKGKAVPLQAWSGPEGSRKLRFPDFMTTAQDGDKVVNLTHCPPLPPGNAPGIHFC